MLFRSLWVWGGLILLFFSLPASKLAGYVLPVIPALAGVLGGLGLRLGWGEGRALPVAWQWGAGAAAALCLVLIAGVRVADDRAAHPLVPALKQALAQAPQGDVQLVYVETFAYDLPYLLGQAQPVPMFTDWDEIGRAHV